MENLGLNKNYHVNTNQSEQMLYNATIMTEMAMDIKEKCHSANKHLSDLRNSTVRAYKSLNSILRENESFLALAHKLALSVAYLNEHCEYSKKYNNIKYETDKLLTILEKELADIEDPVDLNSNNDCFKNISEKLKHMEDRQRSSDLNSSSSARSSKSDIDEKYPEKWLKNSFLDLNNAVNLPPVPEYMPMNNLTAKTPSKLYSLKKYRRIKLLLKRVESNSDEENDESGSEGQNLSNITLVSIITTERTYVRPLFRDSQ